MFKLKALLRKAAARTYKHLWHGVGRVCDLFTDEECYNFCKAAGYETNLAQPALMARKLTTQEQFDAVKHRL